MLSRNPNTEEGGHWFISEHGRVHASRTRELSGSRTRPWAKRSITAALSALMPLSLLPLLQTAIAPSALAATAGSGLCAQTVGSTSGVTVVDNGNGTCTLTFAATGSSNTWTVPGGGLTNVTFEIKGARGTSGLGGATFTGTINALTEGEVLTIEVGRTLAANATGSAFPNGGASTSGSGYGGGGATQVTRSGARVLVAGGGGGGGTSFVAGSAANGGNASNTAGGSAGVGVITCSPGPNAGRNAGDVRTPLGLGGSTGVRGSGAGGGGYAGGGGGAKTANTNCVLDDHGGYGGNGSSYRDSTFASSGTNPAYNNNNEGQLSLNRPGFSGGRVLPAAIAAGS